MENKINSFSTQELLVIYAQIIEELRDRKVVRTSNGPVGDYAEWLVSQKMNLTLANNSNSGFDAIDTNGVKFQIKSRRVTPHNKSTQLSAIRNLDSNDFDFLIAVIFNEFFKPIIVLQVPQAIIVKYARFSHHVNAHLLRIRENIINDPMVKDLTPLFYKK